MGIEIDEWEGCYEGGWKGWIVPEAYAHPAKFSRALIERIYDHALNEGWIEAGGIVLDPFAGVALGGLNAMAMGLNWVGMELEEKFVELGEQNIELWNRELAGWPNLGTARIIKGDSRKLKSITGSKSATDGLAWDQAGGDSSSPSLTNLTREASLIVASPPFQGSLESKDVKFQRIARPGRTNQCSDYGKTEGQLGQMPEGNFQDVIEKADLVMSSPPFSSIVAVQDNKFYQKCLIKINRNPQGESVKGHIDYGHTPGNLAKMKEGDIDLVVSSPPFCSSLQANEKGEKDRERLNLLNKKIAQDGHGHGGNMGPSVSVAYDHSPGQLGSMKEGSIDAVIGSPPFVNPQTHNRGHIMDTGTPAMRKCKNSHAPAGFVPSNTDGQLGNLKEGSFNLITSSPPYEGTHIGADDNPYANTGGKSMGETKTGHLVQSKNYGEFQSNLGNSSGDTFWSASKTILEQCFDLLKDGGHAIFVTKNYVKAKQIVPFTDRWISLCESVGFKLVCHHHAMLVGLKFEKNHVKIVERKSFFRRLAESRGSPRIDWESVICFVK